MFISSCCSTPQSHLFGDMRSHLINFPNLSYLKIQQPVTPFGKVSSVTVKGLCVSLLHRKFPKFGRNRTVGRKEKSFFLTKLIFSYLSSLHWALKIPKCILKEQRETLKRGKLLSAEEEGLKSLFSYCKNPFYYPENLYSCTKSVCSCKWCTTLVICEEEKLIICLHSHVKMLFRPRGCLCFTVMQGMDKGHVK